MASINSITLNGTNGQVLIGSSGGVPIYANITSTGGTITITAGSNTLNLEASAMALPEPLITIFNASGNWTKSSGCKNIAVIIWNGGAGGGSGRVGATTAAGGGGGGSGGASIYWYGPSSFFGATESVIVGVGGLGASSPGTSTSDGVNGGTLNTQSSFGSLAPFLQTTINGRAGTATNSATPVGTGMYTLSQLGTVSYIGTDTINTPNSTGATGTNAAGNTATAISDTYGRAGSGGGGGGYNASTERAGGSGTALQSYTGSVVIVAAANGGIESGTINGDNGADGVYDDHGILYGGLGGGGGGGQSTGPVAGNGGNGGFPGGGGGGGGGSLTGTNSGAGGNGGAGLVVVIEYYS